MTVGVPAFASADMAGFTGWLGCWDVRRAPAGCRLACLSAPTQPCFTGCAAKLEIASRVARARRAADRRCVGGRFGAPSSSAQRWPTTASPTRRSAPSRRRRAPAPAASASPRPSPPPRPSTRQSRASARRRGRPRRAAQERGEALAAREKEEEAERAWRASLDAAPTAPPAADDPTAAAGAGPRSPARRRARRAARRRRGAAAEPLPAAAEHAGAAPLV